MKLTALPVALLLAAAGVASGAPTDTSASPLDALKAAKSVQVTETIFVAGESGPLQPTATFAVTLAQPGMAHMEQSHTGAKTPDLILISDGKTVTVFRPANHQFQHLKADTPNELGPSGLPALGDYSAPEVATTTVLDGKPALLYNGPPLLLQGQTLTQRLWVDPATHLPERQSTMTDEGDAAKEVQRVVFSDWSLGKTVSPALFAFTPPAGTTEFKPQPPPELLAKGTPAPDFTAMDKDGKPVKLSDYRGKVVVIDFWASWCPPCRASMPHNQEVAKKLQDAGTPFVLLAVDNSEGRDAFLTWVAKNGPDMSALTFVHMSHAPRKSPESCTMSREYRPSMSSTPKATSAHHSSATAARPTISPTPSRPPERRRAVRPLS